MVAIKASDLIPKSNKSSGGGGDGGGAGSTENVSEDWTRFGKKQILSIGNKKRHRGLQVQNDIEEDDVGGGGGYNSSSDEEEGRTSAVREKKKTNRKYKDKKSTHTTAVAAANTTLAADDDAPADTTIDSAGNKKKKKEKKKKGKKERAKENKVKAVEEPIIGKEDDTKTAGDVPPTESNNNNKADTAETATSTKILDTTEPKQELPKRKRKKVRSRQKNIRKDNRSTTEKPSHLVLGSEKYAGRVMTMETRKRLGIEDDVDTTNTNNKKKIKHDRVMNIAFDSGEWVGGGVEKKKKISDGDNAAPDSGAEVKESAKESRAAAVTQIGDCLVGDDDTVSKEKKGVEDDKKKRLEKKAMKKMAKIKKKRKFKNC